MRILMRMQSIVFLRGPRSRHGLDAAGNIIFTRFIQARLQPNLLHVIVIVRSDTK